jgi:hypothetical protein
MKRIGRHKITCVGFCLELDASGQRQRSLDAATASIDIVKKLKPRYYISDGVSTLAAPSIEVVRGGC